MYQFGFSYVGLIFLLMLFIPNIIFSRNPPADYDRLTKNENRLLLVLERTGQVLVTCISLIFSDFNLRKPTLWSIWLAAAFLILVLYEFRWVKYFKSDRTLKSFYEPFSDIPVPLAVLPVAAFQLLGIYGKNLFLIAATLILGVGHIGIHIAHFKEIS